MHIKLGRVVTYYKGVAPIKSYDSLITWSFQITLQTRTIIYPLQQCLWPLNLAGWWLNMKSFHRDHMTNWNHYILSVTLPSTTKLDRVVKLLFKEPIFMQSYDPSITWSCEITCQTKTLFLQYHNTNAHQIWEVVTDCEGLPLWIYMIIQSSSFAGSRAKWNTL